MTGPDGLRARLDDVLGAGWVLLHARHATPQPDWAQTGIPSFVVVAPASAATAKHCLVDDDGVLLAWMDRHQAATLALRPDGYVYAAARAGARLAASPTGLHVPSHADSLRTS